MTVPESSPSGHSSAQAWILAVVGLVLLSGVQAALLLLRPGGLAPGDGAALVVADALTRGQWLALGFSPRIDLSALFVLPWVIPGLPPWVAALAGPTLAGALRGLAVGHFTSRAGGPAAVAAILAVLCGGPWVATDGATVMATLILLILPSQGWRRSAASCVMVGLAPALLALPWMSCDGRTRAALLLSAGIGTALILSSGPTPPFRPDLLDLLAPTALFAVLLSATPRSCWPLGLASLATGLLLAVRGPAWPDHSAASAAWSAMLPSLCVPLSLLVAGVWSKTLLVLGLAGAVLLGADSWERRGHGLLSIDPRLGGAWSLGLRDGARGWGAGRCGALGRGRDPCRRGVATGLGWRASPPLSHQTAGVSEAVVESLSVIRGAAADPELVREAFFGLGLALAWPLRGGTQQGLPLCRQDDQVSLDHRDWCEIAAVWSRVRDGMDDGALQRDLPTVEDGGRPLFARAVGLHNRAILAPGAVAARCSRALPPRWADLCGRGAAQWERALPTP